MQQAIHGTKPTNLNHNQKSDKLAGKNTQDQQLNPNEVEYDQKRELQNDEQSSDHQQHQAS